MEALAVTTTNPHPMAEGLQQSGSLLLLYKTHSASNSLHISYALELSSSTSYYNKVYFDDYQVPYLNVKLPRVFLPYL